MTSTPETWSTAATLPAQEFIATYPPFEGTTWPDVVRTLTEDPAEADIIEQLRLAARSGTLREPVVVIWDEETNTWSIANGMHRTVACLLENEPIAYVTSWPEPPTGYETYEATITARVREGDDPEQVWEDLFGWLRSFPVADIWVDSPVMGGQGNPDGTLTAHAYYECPPRFVTDLETAISKQASRVTGEILSISLQIVHDKE